MDGLVTPPPPPSHLSHNTCPLVTTPTSLVTTPTPWSQNTPPRHNTYHPPGHNTCPPWSQHLPPSPVTTPIPPPPHLSQHPPTPMVRTASSGHNTPPPPQQQQHPSPWKQRTIQYGQCAGGTHPTVMYTCFMKCFVTKCHFPTYYGMK